MVKTMQGKAEANMLAGQGRAEGGQGWTENTQCVEQGKSWQEQSVYWQKMYKIHQEEQHEDLEGKQPDHVEGKL